VVDKPLSEDQMIGEALAIVMGTTREAVIKYTLNGVPFQILKAARGRDFPTYG